jgi:endonuclease IV
VARLGAHVPTAGGVKRAFANARASGCEALQVFVNTCVLPSAICEGMTIIYQGRPHRILSITSHRDQVHGRLYHLELETDGERVSLTVREGVEVEVG